MNSAVTEVEIWSRAIQPESGSLSAAGRLLFAVSRLQKSQANDADRLRKYLARFGLDWSCVAG